MANERETAASFCREVLTECGRFPFQSVQMFTVLDRVSTDGTYELLRELAKEVPGLQPVYAEENRCVVDAYMRGYLCALEAECDWILEIDAGFSHLPSQIPAFIETMAQGYDAVFGSRFCLGGGIRDSSWSRELVSLGGTFLANALLDTTFTDMTSGFELFSRDTLEAILAKGIRSKGPFFQTEIRYHAHAFHVTEVPITYSGANHQVGQSALKDSLANLWKLYRDRGAKARSSD